MSDRVPEQALVYIDCPGEDCEWRGPVMADVSTSHAREKRIRCPGCGRLLDLRTELDLTVTVAGRARGSGPREVSVIEGETTTAHGRAV